MTSDSGTGITDSVTIEDIERLLARFYSANPKVRANAVVSLAHAGPLGMAALTRVLRNDYDHSDTTRVLAASALQEIGESAIPSLSEALNEPRSCQLAANALAGIGQPAIAMLREALINTHELIRGASAGALLKIGTPEALRPLQEVLINQFTDEREAVATRKNRRRKWGTVCVLYALFGFWTIAPGWITSSPTRQFKRAIFLMMQFPVLAGLFAAVTWEASSIRRRHAANAAKWSGDVRLTAPLALMLDDPDAETRNSAAEALKRILPIIKESEPAYVPAETQMALLTGFRRKDEDLTVAILSALEQVGGESVVGAVNKIAKASIHSDAFSERINEAAESCLGAIRTRVTESKHSTTLLRAVDASQNPEATTLVRPAESVVVNPEQLVRAVDV